MVFTRRMFTHGMVVLLLLCLWAGSAVAGRYFKDPKSELGKALNRDEKSFSQAMKQAEEYDREIQKQFTFVNNKKVLRRPTGIVDRLAANIPVYNNYTFTTRVIKNDDANAFNTGGLYVYVFTGLLDLAKTDDSLAFVLSHEIAHTIAGHHARLQEKVMKERILVALLGALIKSKTVNRVISTYHDYSSHRYSRNHEREADVIGAYYAYLAGYDPLAGAQFFEALYEQQGGQAGEILQILSGSPLFSTHPRLRERIKRINAVGGYLSGNTSFDNMGPEVQYVLAAILTDDVRKKAELNYARKHYAPYQRILEKVRQLRNQSE